MSNTTISGENADPDGDGINNLLEYAYVSDPWTIDPAVSPVMGTAQGHLTLTFRKLRAATDIFTGLQASEDLASRWTFPDNVVSSTDTSHADYDLITLTDPLTMSGRDHRFLRLTVAVDSDQDGLPDDWELRFFGNLDHLGGDDDDFDLLTNLMEYRQQTNPTDFFNGETPVVSITGGDAQTGFAGSDLAMPLAVTVYHRDGSTFWPSAPVVFVTASGGNFNSTASPVTVTADSAGVAKVSYILPGTAGTSSITATVGKVPNTSNVTFHETASGLPPDLGPITTEGTGTEIIVSWETTPAASGYSIQRQIAGTWTTVASKGADDSSFTDSSSNLQPGVIAIYRVLGNDGTSLHAESSVEGGVINPADNNDTDTMSNGEEVAAGSYSEERATQAIVVGNLAFGGNPAGWMGPDPKLGDTDTDGVADDQDGWANDPDYSPARIPFSHYAVINLDEWGIESGDDIVALNDQLQLAINHFDANGHITAYRWNQGAKTPLTLPTNSSGICIAGMNNLGSIVGEDYTNPGATPSSVIGTAWVWNQPDAAPAKLPQIHPDLGNDVELYKNPERTFNHPVSINDAGAIVGSSGGDLLRRYVNTYGVEVSDRAYFSAYTLWNGGSASVIGGVSVSVDSSDAEKTSWGFDHTSSIQFNPRIINTAGWVLGERREETDESFYYSGAVKAANDSSLTVVANSSYGLSMDGASPPHLAGTYYDSNVVGNGSTVRFNIHEKNSSGECESKTIAAGYAESINDRGELTGYFDRGARLLKNMKPVNLDQVTPAGWSLLSPEKINSQGVIAGSATYTDPANPSATPVTKKMMAVPHIEFKARDGMIEKGFDPPMKGDRGKVELDDQNWEYWASVGRSGDLITNNALKIVFPNAELAKECHLEVKEGADSVDISPTIFTTAETDLTITGKNSTAVDITDARIEVMRGTQKIGFRLRVKVMPVRTVRLGIYYVTDSTSPVANNLPPSTPSADSIITRMNTIYRQACIQFVKDPTSGAKDIPYDDVARDGVMDGCIYDDPEAKRVYTSTSLTGQINLAIVRHLNHPPPDLKEKPLGIWPGSGNVVLAWTEQFESDDPSYESFNHVCAHEVGHALKLSDRIDHSKSVLGSKHDSGPYPFDPKTSALVYKSGYLERGALMKRDTNPHEWMRHEDWDLANKSTILLKP